MFSEALAAAKKICCLRTNKDLNLPIFERLWAN
jgi:hypothetical protein